MYRGTDTDGAAANGGRPDPPVMTARLSQTEATRLYDRLAWIYDVWGRLTETRARQRALELAALRNGECVCEVAVGTGLAFVHLVGSNPDGYSLGFDISTGMLERARARLAKAGCRRFALFVADTIAIPVADGSCDLLLNNYMFDLLDVSVWPRVLAEFRRVLRPGGRLVLANMTMGETPGSGLYQRLYRISPRMMGGCRGVRLGASLETSGFVVQRREYLQQLLFPSEVILATRADRTA